MVFSSSHTLHFGPTAAVFPFLEVCLSPVKLPGGLVFYIVLPSNRGSIPSVSQMRCHHGGLHPASFVAVIPNQTSAPTVSVSSLSRDESGGATEAKSAAGAW